MTTGFFDAVCPSCHKKFGWRGSARVVPPCPHCGHVTVGAGADANTKADAVEIDRFREFLRDKRRAELERESERLADQKVQAAVAEMHDRLAIRPPVCHRCNRPLRFTTLDATNQGGPPAGVWFCWSEGGCGAVVGSYEPGGPMCLPPSG